MTLKKLMVLGGVLAGAAYLQNKDRRNRLMTRGRNFLDDLRARADEMRHKASIAGTERGSAIGTGTSPGMGSASSRDIGVGSSTSDFGTPPRPPTYR